MPFVSKQQWTNNCLKVLLILFDAQGGNKTIVPAEAELKSVLLGILAKTVRFGEAV
jgi:hypothetical protein